MLLAGSMGFIAAGVIAALALRCGGAPLPSSVREVHGLVPTAIAEGEAGTLVPLPWAASTESEGEAAPVLRASKDMDV